MKVLDLQCGNGHGFEGWFGSEADYIDQKARALVQCPMCSDSQVQKKLSAPRLNFGPRNEGAVPLKAIDSSAGTEGGADPMDALTQAWLDISKHVVATTTDVGSQFAEEARKMHYGEAEERAIRGRASQEETQSLLEEGINVLPLLLPNALKKPLQ
ncbi:DUF1178 family protein [Rhodoferax aquaticus]|uniref:DUF1178 family protein n=1 Tax=Rhodoferax aquaticus TaxID=2527691 RepID=A0A515EQJ9_9BURK|nr:DUF1178 family protein [Rhodoferax aquaticus]QDL54919.1 DUF1178 family protein [Rhodoferax aquaticus]